MRSNEEKKREINNKKNNNKKSIKVFVNLTQTHAHLIMT